MVLILLVLLILVCVLITFKQLRKYSAINKIPGPSTFNVLKFILCIKSNEDIAKYIQSLSEKYGGVVKLWIKPFKPALLISDSKVAKYLLTSKDHLQKTTMYNLLFDLVGTNGLPQNPDVLSWKSDRKLMGAFFTGKEVSQHIYKFKKHADTLKMLLEGQENKVVNIADYMQQTSLQLILDYLTGENISTDTQTTKKIVNDLETYLAILTQRSYTIYKEDLLFKYTQDYKIWNDCCQDIHDFMSHLINNAVKSKSLKNNSLNKNSFMDILIDSGFSHDYILSHVTTFVLAGFETVSRTISFAFFEIARRPEVQANILKEYLAVMEGNNSMLKLEDLQTMVYTESLIKETLRYYPTVPIIPRKSGAPTVIESIEIPSDVDLYIDITTLQKSSEIDRPFEFDPERFLPENLHKIPSSFFMAFSIGPRDCIGRNVAMAEMKYIISYIIRHFTLHLTHPEKELDLVVEMTLKSKNGVPIIFKKRKL